MDIYIHVHILYIKNTKLSLAEEKKHPVNPNHFFHIYANAKLRLRFSRRWRRGRDKRLTVNIAFAMPFIIEK